MKSVIVVGAGAVGCNAALFLERFGFRVTLVEAAADILQGAPQASFINHGDGFEYYKRRHRRTGEACVEGSLVKALVYPLGSLATEVCDAARPIRFFVSQGSIDGGQISKAGFLENAEHMRVRYAGKYSSLQTALELSDEQAAEIFVRPPNLFMKELEPEEFEDVHGAAGGAAGIGFGINMPHYYAMLKQALRQSKAAIGFNSPVDWVRPRKGSGYEVRAGGETYGADQALICAAHHIPGIVATMPSGSGHKTVSPGTYYLNSMTFLRLPATKDSAKLAAATRINFTLMENHGGMYACIVPPTESEDGLAATYYPDPSGSHRARHSTEDGVDGPPEAWDDLIVQGAPSDDAHVRRTFEQACRIYPFLAGYAEPVRTICRTVFNASVIGSDKGRDRRVREITGENHRISEDGFVSAWTAPKWTNAELAALMAVDHVLQTSGHDSLPRDDACGCGPTKLDAAKIAPRISFRDVGFRVEDAMRYAETSYLPARMVRRPLAAR